MSVERIFLDWSTPCLETAAEFLISRFPSKNGLIDMRSIVLVLPGKRAERQLLELLVQKAEKLQGFLLPAERLTVGALPEILYQPEFPAADKATRILTWIKALECTPPDQLCTFLRSSLGEEGRKTDLEKSNCHSAFLALSLELDECLRQLTGSGYLPQTALALLQRSPNFSDELRWEAFAKITDQYLILLRDSEVSDSGVERINALQQKRLSSDKSIILIGVSEMRTIIKKMLIASESQVTSLIHAPKQEEQSFDEVGCALITPWASRKIHISKQQLHFSNVPEEQAEQLSGAMLARLQDASTSASHRTSEEKPKLLPSAVIGTADPEVVPFLNERFESFGIPLHIASGLPFALSSPGKLIGLLQRYLSGGRDFKDFAALVRHPDLLRLIALSQGEQPGAVLSTLDNYYSRVLPVSTESMREGKSGECAREILEAFTDIFAPLLQSSLPLAETLGSLVHILERIYPEEFLLEELASGRATATPALEILLPLIESIANSKQTSGLTLAPAQSLKLLISLARAEMVPTNKPNNSLEVLGWLELHLDPTETLYLSGANEGYLPESLTSHFFLPDSLRRLLEIPHNEHRLARDMYLLSAMINCKNSISFFLSRNTSEGEALLPSRLILADTPKVAAARAIDFYSEENRPPETKSSQAKSSLIDSILVKPILPQDPKLKLSVTELNDYLSCPFGYYLKHILKLQEVNDAAEELDALQFGTLAHEVLKNFADLEFSPSFLNSDALGSLLGSLLDKEARVSFGQKPAPAVTIQLEQLRVRLRRFAVWQSSWFEAGWKISQVETLLPEECCSLELLSESENANNNAIIIRAKIDRIDYNSRTGNWMLFDYKTGDKAKSIKKIYDERNSKWRDIQLPLYQILYYRTLNHKGIETEDKIRAAYLNLSKDEQENTLEEECLTEELIASAYECVLSTAENIVNCNFWPPSDEKQFINELEALRLRGLEYYLRTQTEPRDEWGEPR